MTDSTAPVPSLDPRALSSRYVAMVKSSSEEHDEFTRRIERMEAESGDELKSLRLDRMRLENDVDTLKETLAQQKAELGDARDQVAGLSRELERRCVEIQTQDERLATLLAFLPNRDAAVIFDKGQVRREDLDAIESPFRRGGGAKTKEKVVVTRFVTKMAAPQGNKSGPYGDMDLRRFHSAVSTKHVPSVTSETRQLEKLAGLVRRPFGVTATAQDVDRLEAALAARTAAFALYRTEHEARRQEREREYEDRVDAITKTATSKAGEVREFAQALIDERRRRVKAETDLEQATASCKAQVDDFQHGTADLRSRLETEAFAARQALIAELDGATRVLCREKDQAVLAKDEALRTVDDLKRRFADDVLGYEAKIKKLETTLRKLRKQRKLEVEGLGHDLALLRTKLKTLEPTASKRAALAPSSQARRFAKRVVEQ